VRGSLPGVSLKLELHDFDDQLAKLARPGAPIARALNRSINSGRTLATRLIASDLGLKVGDVREFVSVQEARADRLEASVQVSARRIPLIKFGAAGPDPHADATQPGFRGVTVKMKGGAGHYFKAFIARMPSGHVGVFQRRGRRRLPIDQLHGPSPWRAYQKHQPTVVARVQEQLAKTLPHEIEYAVSRAQG